MSITWSIGPVSVCPVYCMALGKTTLHLYLQWPKEVGTEIVLKVCAGNIMHPCTTIRPTSNPRSLWMCQAFHPSILPEGPFRSIDLPSTFVGCMVRCESKMFCVIRLLCDITWAALNGTWPDKTHVGPGPCTMKPRGKLLGIRPACAMTPATRLIDGCHPLWQHMG